MRFEIVIILLLAMVGVVSLAIVALDFICMIINNIKKDGEEAFDERVSDPKT